MLICGNSTKKRRFLRQIPKPTFFYVISLHIQSFLIHLSPTVAQIGCASKSYFFTKDSFFDKIGIESTFTHTICIFDSQHIHTTKGAHTYATHKSLPFFTRHKTVFADCAPHFDAGFDHVFDFLSAKKPTRPDYGKDFLPSPYGIRFSRDHPHGRLFVADRQTLVGAFIGFPFYYIINVLYRKYIWVIYFLQMYTIIDTYDRRCRYERFEKNQRIAY